MSDTIYPTLVQHLAAIDDLMAPTGPGSITKSAITQYLRNAAWTSYHQHSLQRMIHGMNDATDDLAAFLSARNALASAGGGVIRFDGVLNLSSMDTSLYVDLFSGANPVCLQGASPHTSVIVVHPDAGTVFKVGSSVSLFPGTPLTVTQSVSPGWQSFNKSSHGLAANDWIYLYDSDNPVEGESDLISGATALAACELNQVWKVQGDTVYLKWPVKRAMHALRIIKSTNPVQRWFARDFRIACSSPPGDYALVLFAIRRAVHWSIENVHLDGTTGRLALLQDAGPGIIDRCIDSEGMAPGNQTNEFVAFSGVTRDITVRTARVGVQRRHAIDFSGSVISEVQYQSHMGAVIESCKFVNCGQPNVGHTINMHGGDGRITIRDCEIETAIYGLRAGTPDTIMDNVTINGRRVDSCGITIAAARCEVKNSTVRDCTIGVHIERDGALVSNNRIEGCLVGITSAGYDASNATVTRNLFRGAPSNAAPVVYAARNLYPSAIAIDDADATGWKITHNDFVRAAETRCIWVGLADTTDIIQTMMGNCFDGWGNPNEDTESPIYDNPIFSGVYASTSADTELLAEWQTRNFWN